MIQKIDIKDASIAEEVRKNMAEATKLSKGLFIPSMFEVLKSIIVPVDEVAMQKPLTDQVNRLVAFTSVYIPNITPNANWIFGFAFRAGGSIREVQFLFDFAGKIYRRAHDGNEWDKTVVITM